MQDKYLYFFFKETIILIRIHKYESSVQNFLNRLIIYYIIKIIKELVIIYLSEGQNEANMLEILKNLYMMRGKLLGTPGVP